MEEETSIQQFGKNLKEDEGPSKEVHSRIFTSKRAIDDDWFREEPLSLIIELLNKQHEKNTWNNPTCRRFLIIGLPIFSFVYFVPYSEGIR